MGDLRFDFTFIYPQVYTDISSKGQKINVNFQPNYFIQK